MSVLDTHMEWKRTSDKTTSLVISDAIQVNVNKSTEIKNNIFQITVKNSATKIAADGTTIIGEYVDPNTQLIMFGEDDELRMWATFLTDASEVGTQWYDDSRAFGAFAIAEYELQTMEDQSRIQVKAVDVAYLMFNKVFSYSYGLNEVYTAPGIMRHLIRYNGEAGPNTVTTHLGTHHDIGTLYAINTKFVSEGGYITDYRNTPTTVTVGSTGDADTTVLVSSTDGFESSGSIVIDTEHISYTGITDSSFTGCTRGIDDTLAVAHASDSTVYQGFPPITLNLSWTALFDWITQLGQVQNTNYLNEIQEGGVTYFNRAFIFWIDKNNEPHWVFPDDTVNTTITLADEGKRAFKLDKSVFDAVNFVIYNCGADMYGHGVTYYWYDQNSNTSALKMRYQPMTKITNVLIDEDLKVNTTRDTTNQNKYQQFPTGYPLTPSFLDLANRFRALSGDSARTTVANDTEYNDCLREASRMKGLIEAQKITTLRSGLRYKGTIAMKGTHLNPGDLLEVNNAWNGLNAQKVRVTDVHHIITAGNWETTVDVQEDDKTYIYNYI